MGNGSDGARLALLAALLGTVSLTVAQNLERDKAVALQDHYETLSVPVSASLAIVRHAYHCQSVKWVPNTNPYICHAYGYVC